MATNLAIDDSLIITAQKIGGHKTKKEAVTEALKDYIRHHKQLSMSKLFGKINFSPSYNYKTQRKKT